MSFEHLDAAADLELGNPTAKLVLIPLARAACLTCGIAWPGVAFMVRKTGLGTTAVRKGLDWLEAHGLVLVHAYPKGGRGRSTEYIVLPGVMKLSTAPCEQCRLRMKTPRDAVGLLAERQREALGIRENPPLTGSETHREAATNQSENHNQSRAYARTPEAEAPAAPSPIVTPPVAPPTSGRSSTSPVRVGDLLQGFGRSKSPDVP